MIDHAPNINHLWARLMVEELVRCAVTQFFLAPGSRSTSVTMAAAEHPRVETVVHFDERGAAFAALGYGRATDKPAAWVTTSGTAVANGFPAIVEASKDGVPMLLLTADRPPELRDTGANQTIDQVHLFGRYVRWQVDMPAPSVDVSPEMVLTTVDQAVHRAESGPSGPVHLNLMVREPLAPEPDTEPPDGYTAALAPWRRHEEPFTRYETPVISFSEREALARVLESLKGRRRVLLVAGRMASQHDAEAALRLAQHKNWPLLPDVASQLRFGCHDTDDVRIYTYDHLVSGTSAIDHLAPDAVIQVGAVPTSKRLLQALRSWRPHPYVHVHEDPYRLDPYHHVTHRVQTSIKSFCDEVAHLASPSTDQAYRATWKEMDDRAATQLDTFFETTDVLSEPLIARLVTQLSPEGRGLVLASSMPVRDVDMYGARYGTELHVAANRGASGIDGLVATAAGFARGRKAPVTLLTGDLALLHDLNSLALLREHPVVVVVINNDGGGIFSFLPIARHDAVFEPYFGTPHGLTFESAASLFNIQYLRVESRQHFEDAYLEACTSENSVLIEVTTDRDENHVLHQRLLALVQDVL